MQQNKFISALKATGLTDRAALYQAKEGMIAKEEEARKKLHAMSAGFFIMSLLIVPALVTLPLLVFTLFRASKRSGNKRKIEEAYQAYIRQLDAAAPTA